jgi:hypothetical protein
MRLVAEHARLEGEEVPVVAHGLQHGKVKLPLLQLGYGDRPAPRSCRVPSPLLLRNGCAAGKPFTLSTMVKPAGVVLDQGHHVTLAQKRTASRSVQPRSASLEQGVALLDRNIAYPLWRVFLAAAQTPRNLCAMN